MLIDLIAAAAAAFAAAGVMLVLRHLSRGRLPGYVVPMAAGLAAIGYTIWSEYTWFERTTTALPQGVEVVSSTPVKSFYRPWTYAFPVTERFMAVDRVSIRRHSDHPGQMMVEAFVIARRGARARLPMLLDCNGSRWADVADGATFGEDGAVTDARWLPLETGDPILATLCRPG